MNGLSGLAQSRIDACAALWRQGGFREETFLMPLVELFVDCRPEDVVDRLPGELASRFRDWLRENFGDATPASDLFFVDSALGRVSAEAFVRVAREYLARSDRNSSGR